MSSIFRVTGRPLLILAFALVGCGEATDSNTNNAETAPASVSPETTAKDTPTPAPTAEAAPAPTAEATPTATDGAAAKEPAPAKEAEAPAKKVEGGVEEAVLEPIKFDEFLKRMVNKDAKYTLVDAWASWCAPCKENFPHLVEMHKKFASKGLAVASLSFDELAEPKQVADAKAFLTAKHASFPNYLLDEEQGVGYEKLDINSIPAVFLYGPDGKEVKRYTMDDPNNQFTYEEVENDVVALLDGKPLPAKEKPAKPADEK